MYYVVPDDFKTPDGFFTPIETTNGRLHVKLPLESNPVEKVLRPLARWLSVRGTDRMNKTNLLAQINSRLSWIPMSQAIEKWPQLLLNDELLTLQESNKEYNDITKIRYKVSSETPQFIIHYEKVLQDCLAKRTTLRMEEERQQVKKFNTENEPPSWFEHALRVEPETKPYYKIDLIIEEQGHDGYCTGNDEDSLYIEETENQERFVPEGKWDFYTKTTWRQHHPSHCCCGAEIITKMISVEKIE